MAGIVEGLQLFGCDHLVFRWLRNAGLNFCDSVRLKQEIVQPARDTGRAASTGAPPAALAPALCGTVFPFCHL